MKVSKSEDQSMTPDDLFARGWQHHQAGEHRQAEEDYRALLRKEPRNGRVWFVLGNLCADQGRLPEAAAYIRQALEIEPHEPMGWLHLGNVLLRQDKFAEAEEAYRKCLELPQRREGHATRVEALVNLGFLLGELDRLDEARVYYEQARALNPQQPEVHHNLGNVLREQGKRDEALACYNEALRLRPDYIKALVNKGIALVAGGDIEPALPCLRRAIELDPDFAEAHNSLGTALSASGQVEDALAHYEIAIALKPDYVDAHWNRALVRLLQGDYQRGWPDYEWRWQCRHWQRPAFSQPVWDRGPLAGKTILLYAEQGLGDTLQFIRYAPIVKARGARVILQCQATLIPLLSRCAGLDEIVPLGSPPPAFDVWAALMTLPALVGTTVESIPAHVPYLRADPALVEHWRRQLAPIDGFKVGIAWQGSTTHAWDRHRSVALSAFEPLAQVPGVRLISLQKGTAVQQIQEVASRFAVIDLGDEVDRTAGAFMDTAAILLSLDLVVSVDTSVAHLVGGLNVPLWLALHHTPDWRWLRGRPDSPWYPSARLFRQPAPGDWNAVFAQIAEALRETASRPARRQRLLVEVSAGELLDKLTILRITEQRISDPQKRKNIRTEMEALAGVRESLRPSHELKELEKQLAAVNEQLWDVEDAIRECERAGDFGSRFIELARSVYRTNDQRSALKRAINDLLGSAIVEEKSYAEYGAE
jgi:tetratricopeptide (TPR) repeat protein